MILAIDLGGTSAKVALLKDEKIIKRWVVPTVLGNIFPNLEKNLKDLDWKNVEAIGLSVPGFVNHEESIIVLSGNLGLKNFNVKKEFKKVFNKDAFVINDANAATLGEYWKGSGSKYKTMAFYTIGTGIGGGLIVNDSLIYGHGGFAGEFGHGGNFQNIYECTCGLKNCVEPLSSATGIEKELSKFYGKKTTIKEVAGKLKAGNVEVVDIFRKCLEPLASHMSIIQTAINPEAIVIGGGPSALGKPLLGIMKSLISEKQLPFIMESTNILIASTKNDAGIYGAALWAIRHHKK